MRDIIRLSLTLCVVGILSAFLLTVVHGITEPIIIERQEQEYRQTGHGGDDERSPDCLHRGSTPGGV